MRVPSGLRLPVRLRRRPATAGDLPGFKRASAALAALMTSCPATAFAQQAAASARPSAVSTFEVIQFSVFAGVMGAALLSAIWLIRERGRIAAQNVALGSRVAELGTALRRSDALLNMRNQRFVVWEKDEESPSVIGTLPHDLGAPDDRGAFLAFGRWLTPHSAASLERAIDALRNRGENCDLVIETRSGTVLEVQGRKVMQHAALRFLSLTATQQELARLQLDHKHLLDAYETMIGLAGALKMPFWLRDGEGRLSWVNQAFASAVGGESPALVVRDAQELFSTSARAEIARRQESDPVFGDMLSAVIDGDRRVFNVAETLGRDGAAGIAIDVSEIDNVRREQESTLRSHADTLDQLTTAVAIFDAGQKLRFFNQAFQKLWGLDAGFLDSAPDNTLVLDRLRSEGKLAEQPEWRRWKEQVLSAYRSVESQEHWWHLPDGRTIRVIATPQPRGDVTWVFENLTEKIDLESRYNAAVRVQGETLDNLAEGVAVFGPDGRLRLSNPAFRTLWGLSEELVREAAHISAIRAFCDTVARESPWGDFVAAATGFDEERVDRHGRTELNNGDVLSYATIHLPNGQVMMTFVDVTDSVNVERALKERNEALQKADQLKNDFVQHVSYELRSPLTNIIGFTELLAIERTGTLNQRQREYIDHIGTSSSLLLTVVNDILDLATVDAGIMELDIAEVKIGPLVQSACDLIAERLNEHGIAISVDLRDAGTIFHADENRVRQVLFNLLSNAANYAPEKSTIALSAGLAGDVVEFRVHDDGPGMSPDILETIFKRFEPRSNGGRKRGAGLGLSVVKSFVELHGGTVSIRTDEGSGTTVVCRFPLSGPSNMRDAAE